MTKVAEADPFEKKLLDLAEKQGIQRAIGSSLVLLRSTNLSSSPVPPLPASARLEQRLQRSAQLISKETVKDISESVEALLQ